jgi:aspartyl-tRNA(Asn)/glutamyl-tRNA(Gln) amidotransferase subunit A
VTVTSDAPDKLPLTITAAASALRTGTLTSVELTQAVLARADKLDAKLGTYITRMDASALEAAATADAELAAGTDRGVLHGIPLGVKDIIATEGAGTTAQSLIMDPAFGEMGDAPVVTRLKAAGGIVVGKATTMEYAIGEPDPSKGFPTPRNPFDPAYWTGGSSSGTGNGVAAGLFLGGLGTDTGGSVRLPAAWCGISGLKQTFGRVPKYGCVPLGYTYDHIGPMTRSARDCAHMLAVMAGHDNRDATSVDVPVDDYVGALTGDLTGLKIGVDLSLLDKPFTDPALAELARAAVQVLADAGATLVDVRLPLYDELTTATMSGFLAEAFMYHRGDMRKRWTDYGKPTRKAVGQGALVTGADYVQIQRVRRVGVRLMAELMTEVDLIVNPATLVFAPQLDGMNFFENEVGAICTPYWNALGLPAISIPMGSSPIGLPAGLQIAGKPFDEATVLKAADAFQLRTDFHLTESEFVKETLA